MKSDRWLILIAALLITAGEVLVFRIESDQAPQTQANGAAVTDVGSGRHSPGEYVKSRVVRRGWS
jgi:hypothetical protein